MANLYCKMYVDASLSRVELIQFIASSIEGSIDGRSIQSSFLDIDVSENEDFSPERVNESGGFVFYHYYLDIDPNESAAEDRYIESVSKLLRTLRAAGFRSVAACDFEEALPK